MSASRKHNPLVTCNCCDGKGMVPLSDELVATLNVTKRMSVITAPKVAKALKFKGGITAINNRLNDLVDLKFFTRAKNGVVVVYTPIKY